MKLALSILKLIGLGLLASSHVNMLGILVLSAFKPDNKVPVYTNAYGELWLELIVWPIGLALGTWAILEYVGYVGRKDWE